MNGRDFASPGGGRGLQPPPTEAHPAAPPQNAWAPHAAPRGQPAPATNDQFATGPTLTPTGRPRTYTPQAPAAPTNEHAARIDRLQQAVLGSQWTLHAQELARLAQRAALAGESDVATYHLQQAARFHDQHSVAVLRHPAPAPAGLHPRQQAFIARQRALQAQQVAYEEQRAYAEHQFVAQQVAQQAALRQSDGYDEAHLAEQERILHEQQVEVAAQERVIDRLTQGTGGRQPVQGAAVAGPSTLTLPRTHNAAPAVVGPPTLTLTRPRRPVNVEALKNKLQQDRRKEAAQPATPAQPGTLVCKAEIKPDTDPETKAKTTPETKAAPEADTKKTSGPVVKAVPEPVAKEAPKPVTKAAPELVAKETPDPQTKAVPEPVTKATTPKSKTKGAPKPVTKLDINTVIKTPAPDKRCKPAQLKMLLVGDRVVCALRPDMPPEAAVVVAKDTERVYVHYVKRDRRLDRWLPIGEVTVPDANSPVDEEQEEEESKPLTRAKRRQLAALNPVSEREEGNELVNRMEQAREEFTKVKNVDKITFGNVQLDAWYFSPFPGKFGQNVANMYMCPHCLKYCRRRDQYREHLASCDWTVPPGKCIYRDKAGEVAVHEIDGLANVGFCQRLCLLGKLFLDHKTLFFDVAPFYFYVITYRGELAGFFSKEKPLRGSVFNLACIMCLPHHQRRGIGRFLIALSYELSRREGKPGGPERPLSDLGQVSYRSYWTQAIVQYVASVRTEPVVRVEDVSKATGIQSDDVIFTLKEHGMHNHWKGEHKVNMDAPTIDSLLKSIRPPRLPLRPDLLDYEPEPVRSSPGERPRSAKRNGKSAGKASSKAAGKAAQAAAMLSAPAPTPSIGKRKRGAPLKNLPRTPEMVIDEYVRRHTPRRVLARLNTPDGVEADDVIKLSHAAGMSMSDAMQKSRRVAQYMLDAENAPVTNARLVLSLKKSAAPLPAALPVKKAREPRQTDKTPRPRAAGRSGPGDASWSPYPRDGPSTPAAAIAGLKARNAGRWPVAGVPRQPAPPTTPVHHPAKGAGSPKHTPPQAPRSPKAESPGDSPGWPTLDELRGGAAAAATVSSKPKSRGRKRERGTPEAVNRSLFNEASTQPPARKMPRTGGGKRNPASPPRKSPLRAGKSKRTPAESSPPRRQTSTSPGRRQRAEGAGGAQRDVKTSPKLAPKGDGAVTEFICLISDDDK